MNKIYQRFSMLADLSMVGINSEKQIFGGLFIAIRRIRRVDVGQVKNGEKQLFF